MTNERIDAFFRECIRSASEGKVKYYWCEENLSKYWYICLDGVMLFDIFTDNDRVNHEARDMVIFYAFTKLRFLPKSADLYNPNYPYNLPNYTARYSDDCIVDPIHQVGMYSINDKINKKYVKIVDPWRFRDDFARDELMEALWMAKFGSLDDFSIEVFEDLKVDWGEYLSLYMRAMGDASPRVNAEYMSSNVCAY